MLFITKNCAIYRRTTVHGTEQHCWLKQGRLLQPMLHWQPRPAQQLPAPQQPASQPRDDAMHRHSTDSKRAMFSQKVDIIFRQVQLNVQQYASAAPVCNRVALLQGCTGGFQCLQARCEAAPTAANRSTPLAEWPGLVRWLPLPARALPKEMHAEDTASWLLRLDVGSKMFWASHLLPL